MYTPGLRPLVAIRGGLPAQRNIATWPRIQRLLRVLRLILAPPPSLLPGLLAPPCLPPPFSLPSSLPPSRPPYTPPHASIHPRLPSPRPHPPPLPSSPPPSVFLVPIHRLLNRLLHVGQAAELSNPDCIQNIYQPHGCRTVPSQRSRDVTSETSPKQTSDDLINLSVPHRSHDTTLVAPTPAHELAFP